MQNKLIDYDLLMAKYLDNEEITPQEKLLLWNWINASDANRIYFEETAKIWEKSIIEMQDTSIAYSFFKQYRERFKKKKLQHYMRAVEIAAIVVTVFGGFLLFQPNLLFGNKMLVVNSEKTKQEVILPDGSVVWLNAESSLKYASKFKRNREVFLEGEAYFDVKKNETKKFSVHTKNITVDVKGTTFLVTDYLKSNISEIVLESGLINLTVNSSGKKIEMKPNHKVVYNQKTGEMFCDGVNASDYTLWRGNSLTFENTLLKDAFIQIEKWYNTDIDCTNQKLLNTPVSFTIDEEKLDEVLELLQYITGLSWKRTSDNKILIR